MPAKSTAQQKLMGAALAVKKGAKPISPKVASLAKSMSKGELEKYAGTKHKGLPKKVKKENEDGRVTEMYAVKTPYSGCKPNELVVSFDPVLGIPQDKLDHNAVHGVYHDRDSADLTANNLYEEHAQYESLVEEKKDSVVNKLKTTIQKLEKERDAAMKGVIATPNTASEHRDKIARLTSRIDDLVNKLEKVNKSKKEKEEEEEE